MAGTSSLCESPGAAETNDHKLGGFEHKFILLQFWGLKSKIGFTGLKVQG